MDYVVTFLEGLVSFISPCMLPLVPIYITYFSADSSNKKTVFLKTLAFTAGLTTTFCILGVFSGAIGKLFSQHRNALNIVSGVLIILFGLSFLEVIHLPFFKQKHINTRPTNIFKSYVFGMLFSINLSPCVGVFLGSALTMAGSSAHALKGLALLFTYSMGLGIPFIISGMLIHKLESLFSFIKKRYYIINRIAGNLLIIIGILMCFGVFSKMTVTIKPNNTVKSEQTEVVDNNKEPKGENKITIEKNFMVKDANNRDVSLSDKLGKPVVVNFWASWCPPCRGEFPAFEKAYNEHKENIEFMMVNLTFTDMGNIDDTINFIKEAGYTFPVYYDTDYTTPEVFNIRGIPHTVFFNSDGTVYKEHIGALNEYALGKYLSELK